MWQHLSVLDLLFSDGVKVLLMFMIKFKEDLPLCLMEACEEMNHLAEQGWKILAACQYLIFAMCVKEDSGIS